MNLAILETGTPPPPLEERFGRYPAMFEALIGLDARSYDVAAGALPPDVGRHDAYLITGSAAGVYDDLPWIPKLGTFLRAAKGKAKLVGIQRGEQARLAQAGHRVKTLISYGEFAQVGDRVVFMDHGEVLEEGAPAQFFTHPRHERLQAFLSKIL